MAGTQKDKFIQTLTSLLSFCRDLVIACGHRSTTADPLGSRLSAGAANRIQLWIHARRRPQPP
jgi:hypothetical protein